MATSQNGWPALSGYEDARLQRLPWITGAVLAGSTFDVLDFVCRRFNADVEPISKASSWGYQPRNIVGASTVSNHASGTAIDLNADSHPLGAVGTFSAGQVAAIHDIIRDCVVDGVPVIRWGGDYAGRKDEMHFEVNLASNGNSPALVEKLANRIRVKEDDMPLTDTDIARISDAVWFRRVARDGKQVPALQELADIKTLETQQQAVIGALRTAIDALAKGQGVDPASVYDAARKGATDALDARILAADVTVTTSARGGQ